jgi:hypothetical protein
VSRGGEADRRQWAAGRLAEPAGPAWWHRSAQDVFAEHLPPAWTCEPVLAEAAYLSGRPRDVVAMVSEGAVRIGLTVQTQAAPLERLLQKYVGQMDLADACVVRLSERALSRLPRRHHGSEGLSRVPAQWPREHPLRDSAGVTPIISDRHPSRCRGQPGEPGGAATRRRRGADELPPHRAARGADS